MPPSPAPAAVPAGVALLGVRHHGPGSARAVRAALDAYRPGTVLIEGPPEADALVGLAAEEGMRPPVALLAHVLDDPARAAFWPFAEFSPEWVAIRWAAEQGVPVAFIDLPAAHSLALRATEGHQETEETEETEEGGEGEGEGAVGEGAPAADGAAAQALRIDPLAVLAETAGYDDPERWWEDAVEHRGTAAGADPLAPFAALADAMGALREMYGHGGHDDDPAREAHMRLRIREARRAHDRVAVVCGAWHVPALAEPVTVAADRQLLKGLPKVKVEMTWVPWTHRRLSRHSGYGAGIDSPGWYGHLFGAPDRPVTRWMTKVAGLLRAEDLPVSSAHVIEAVRLADTLAAMRGRPLAGLSETTDAVRAVMCDGSDIPLALIRDRLVVGDVLGEVPDSAPAVPLARDLTREQRRLRLKPEALERELELDLRKETDAGRSRLLHRLRLLGIEWGEQVRSRAGTGTFRESWRLRWEPELAVRVAEAGVWGTTLLSAATAKAEEGAVRASALAEVTALAERCLVAGLPDALPVVMRVLADRAALETDVGHLAQALPALVRSARYGDVRGTDSAALRKVAEGLAERVCIGLPPACVGLDADGAAEMRGHADAAHRAIGLLQSDTLRERWAVMLRAIAERDGAIPGLLRGSAARLLMDDGRLDETEAARLMGLALSPGTPSAEAAAWLEGFLAGGGMLLVHDERLLALVDGWLAAVPATAFNDVLPLLRRTFSEFEPGVRRTVGELVRRGTSGPRAAAAGDAVPGFGAGYDEARVAAAQPVLRLLLGLTDVEDTDDGDASGADTHDANHTEGDAG
ncbi:DUF5682 family protein [Streptomyces sp. H10-C2]|uniref:DUF5682 family protein n=1 Tax=unclassified Streptomyces TaxID=2593676 RepID=UPI0024BB8616|nr:MULTISPECIES: DUF5682 family protein [unclassified Streptomyces]MDJ0340559.1 DUF5682 family protein [Streptomyces sp. PH10-H1]MDJ0370207.1 DUF5682 family protein [Streptomyces sp. H10-C2]